LEETTIFLTLRPDPGHDNITPTRDSALPFSACAPLGDTYGRQGRVHQLVATPALAPDKCWESVYGQTDFLCGNCPILVHNHYEIHSQQNHIFFE
jgi:hypothetical protein